MDDSQFIESAAMTPLVIPSGTLKFRASIDASVAFRVNTARVHELISLPGFAVMTAQKWISSCTIATNEITAGDFTTETMNAHGREVAARADAIMFQKMQVPASDQPPELYFSTNVFTQFAGRSEYISNALQGLLVSMLILAWTSFEVLVKQLLKFSISFHPECFPHLTGNEEFKFQKTELFRLAYKTAFRSSGSIQSKLHDQSVDALCLEAVS